MECIHIDKLRKGDKIILETKAEVFEITIIDPLMCKVKIESTLQSVNNKRNLFIIGCSCPVATEILEEENVLDKTIYQNYVLHIKHGKKVIVTTPVCTAKVISADKSWEYEMDWKNTNINVKKDSKKKK